MSSVLSYLLENPDGCSDAAQLARAATFARKHDRPELGAYCTEKAFAVRARLDGRINDAMRHESNCESLYYDIPAPDRW